MLCGKANVPALLAILGAVVGLQAFTLPRYLALWPARRLQGLRRLGGGNMGTSNALASLVVARAFLVGHVLARV